jgi:hypothetical protein
MVIRSLRRLLLVLIIILFLGSFGVLTRSSTHKNELLQISGLDLPDKVYLFHSPQDILLLEDIILEQYYIYYLYVEIVTPYNCSVKITLWDPEGQQFNIFENALFVEPEGDNYYEIPFGTALGGNYDIAFEVLTPENVNLYIRMEKGPRCLFDKIPMEEVDDIELYQIARFSDTDSITHTLFFNTDFMYKFYVGRVSPITLMEDNEVKLDLSLEDPDGIIYNIYFNTTLAEIDDIDRFKFGTAIGGLYTFNITIYCNVEHVNIGYSIIGLYQISSGTETNQTEPNNNSTVINRYFTMPTEWTIGILGFAGTISAIIGVILYKQKKKNVIGSNF